MNSIMTYKEIDINEELPPRNNVSYIVRFNGTGGWNNGEVGELTGEQLNMVWAEVVKCWLKPIK